MMKMPKPELYDYQEKGVDFLLGGSEKCWYLADDMGLGKSAQAITAAKIMDTVIQRILVVCPASVIPHWHSEWRKWSPHNTVKMFGL